MTPAVFLDRDGVIIEDVGPVASSAEVRLLPDVAPALSLLGGLGFRLVVVSNQTAIARGLASEATVRAIQRDIEDRLSGNGAPTLDGFYVCPHHPNATDPRFRRDCDCRKPRPGLLLAAASELSLDLRRSFLVGDRLSDIAAGAAAGCRTILVTTGRHAEPPIESLAAVDPDLRPDHVCSGLLAAAQWIARSR